MSKGFSKVEQRTYESWERANIAYHVVYGFYPPDQHIPEESAEFGEMGVRWYLSIIFSEGCTNPLRKRCKSLNHLITWFNLKYPLRTSQKVNTDAIAV